MWGGCRREAAAKEAAAEEAFVCVCVCVCVFGVGVQAVQPNSLEAQVRAGVGVCVWGCRWEAAAEEACVFVSVCV